MQHQMIVCQFKGIGHRNGRAWGVFELPHGMTNLFEEAKPLFQWCMNYFDNDLEGKRWDWTDRKIYVHLDDIETFSHRWC